MFFAKKIVQLEMKNITQGLSDDEVEYIELLYRRRLFVKRTIQVGGIIVVVGGVAVFGGDNYGKRADEEMIGLCFLVGLLVVMVGSTLRMRFGLRLLAQEKVDVPVLSRRRYRTPEQRRVDTAKTVGSILDLVGAFAGAVGKGQEVERKKNIKAILPTPIYNRMQVGKLANEERETYVSCNKDYIRSIVEQIKEWHQKGFDIAGVLRKGISDGLISDPHLVDIAQLQAAVNETIDELWRDLNQAQRKEPKHQPSREEDIEAKDKYEDLIQAKLLKWREKNAPTSDLSRCALLSVWQEDWKKGRELAEYMPVFEAYQEFENCLRNLSA